MRNPEIQAQLDAMRTSERLRMWAQMGAMVRSWGPISENSAHFGDGLLRRKLVPLNGDEAQETVREYIHALHFTGRWAQYGFNVFDLTPDFAASLLLTDPPPTEGELKLPFPCFFIKLPEGVVPLFAH